MFLFSRMFWQLLTPGMLMAVLASLGAICALWGFKRTAACALVSSLCIGAGLCVPPLGRTLLMTLEQRFAARADAGDDVEGIIVLGGVMSRSDMSERLAMLPPPRIATFIRLAQRHPNARLVFSGGSGELDGGGASESLWVRRWLAHAGVDGKRLVLDTESRNTAENAFFSRKLVGETHGKWVLITSALHMPRAVGTFRRHGWDVIAWPVDHLSPPSALWNWDLTSSDAEVLIGAAWREAVGLVVYRLTGRSDALFPSPAEDGDLRRHTEGEGTPMSQAGSGSPETQAIRNGIVSR